MNTVVCIKSVPGVITKWDIGDTRDHIKLVSRSEYMNETDEYALDEALALRKENGGKVTVVSVGRVSSEETLRVALAKGADKAVRIDAASDDPTITSIILAAAIGRMNYDLVLTGLESSDNMAAQVGTATAERLGIPSLFSATKIEITPDKRAAIVTKEVGGGTQVVLEMRLPGLIGTQTGIQQLTYAPAAKLMQARRQGVDCVNMSDLELGENALQEAAKLEFIEVFKPEITQAAEILQGAPEEIAQELITKIQGAL